MVVIMVFTKLNDGTRHANILEGLVFDTEQEAWQYLKPNIVESETQFKDAVIRYYGGLSTVQLKIVDKWVPDAEL